MKVYQFMDKMIKKSEEEIKDLDSAKKDGN